MQEQRINKLLDFLSQDPNDAFLKYALATEYFSMENYIKALHYFDDLVTHHPDYVGTYYHLGKLYLILNRKIDALKIFEKGIQIAKKERDNHALAELQSVYNELIFEE